MRDNGWLDMFKEVEWLSIYLQKQFIGFVGLSGIKCKDFEILMCLNADFIGKRYGTTTLKMALNRYFKEYNMSKIIFTVRKSNIIAKRIYDKISCVDCGESTHTIQGREVEFWDMYMINNSI